MSKRKALRGVEGAKADSCSVRSEQLLSNDTANPGCPLWRGKNMNLKNSLFHKSGQWNGLHYGFSHLTDAL